MSWKITLDRLQREQKKLEKQSEKVDRLKAKLKKQCSHSDTRSDDIIVRLVSPEQVIRREVCNVCGTILIVS